MIIIFERLERREGEIKGEPGHFSWEPFCREMGILK
jgi:hypothetical protein